jgi:plasmid stability protein
MKQLTLRLPDDLHATLKALAASEHRSLHAEILHILSRHAGDADSLPA